MKPSATIRAATTWLLTVSLLATSFLSLAGTAQATPGEDWKNLAEEIARDLVTCTRSELERHAYNAEEEIGETSETAKDVVRQLRKDAQELARPIIDVVKDLYRTINREVKCTVAQMVNSPPEEPEIHKAESGQWGNALEYCASAKDENNGLTIGGQEVAGKNKVRIKFEFDVDEDGEAESSQWSRWARSGETVCVQKIFDQRHGDADLEVYAEDKFKETSGRNFADFAVRGYKPDAADTPTGPTEIWDTETRSYCSSARDPDGDDVKLTFEWRPHDRWEDDHHKTSDWVGSGNQACQDNPTVYGPETYDVCTRAKDGREGEGPWSDPCLQVKVKDNGYPDTPDDPSVPDKVETGTDVQFCSSSSDPDGHLFHIWFGFDPVDTHTWTAAEGEWSGWTTDTGCVTHSFDTSGTWCAEAYAEDEHDADSDWSGCPEFEVVPAWWDDCGSDQDVGETYQNALEIVPPVNCDGALDQPREDLRDFYKFQADWGKNIDASLELRNWCYHDTHIVLWDADGNQVTSKRVGSNCEASILHGVDYGEGGMWRVEIHENGNGSSDDPQVDYTLDLSVDF